MERKIVRLDLKRKKKNALQISGESSNPEEEEHKNWRANFWLVRTEPSRRKTSGITSWRASMREDQFSYNLSSSCLQPNENQGLAQKSPSRPD